MRTTQLTIGNDIRLCTETGPGSDIYRLFWRDGLLGRQWRFVVLSFQEVFYELHLSLRNEIKR